MFHPDVVKSGTPQNGKERVNKDLHVSNGIKIKRYTYRGTSYEKNTWYKGQPV